MASSGSSSNSMRGSVRGIGGESIFSEAWIVANLVVD